MRSIGLAIGMMLILLAACTQDADRVSPDVIYFPDGENPDASQLPVITFVDTLFDFGVVTEGEQIDAVYPFENTGKVPLVLTRVEPSCGCTVAKDWPKDPIHPGEKGEIKVTFDSNKRTGIQKKIISVIANTYPNTTVLHLRGTVVGPEKQ